MSESWDEYAAGWDDNESVNLYSQKAYESLSEIIEIILDFGCGTGLLSEKMAPLAKKIIAIDPSSKMIAVLESKKLPNVTTISKNLSEDSINQQDQVDLIVASSVCSFLPDYEATLVLIKSLLVPNGLFVQWDWLATEKHPDFGFTQERISSALKKSGFSHVSLSRPFSISSSEDVMPVVMAVARNA